MLLSNPDSIGSAQKQCQLFRWTRKAKHQAFFLALPGRPEGCRKVQECYLHRTELLPDSSNKKGVEQNSTPF
jgi:hypothetical protein